MGRQAPKRKAGADRGLHPQQKADHLAGAGGWVSGWAKELEESTAAELPPGTSPPVLAFPHGGGLVSVCQSPAPACTLAVHVAQVGGESATASLPAPFTLEAAAALAGGSVPDAGGGGACRPHLLTRTLTGTLRLLHLDLERGCAEALWDVSAPQGQLLERLVSIGPGPAVVLPQASGELWVACCYAGPSPGSPGQPGEQQPPGSRWRLHKLQLGGGGAAAAMLPCAMCPLAQQRYHLLALTSLWRQPTSQLGERQADLALVSMVLAEGGCPPGECAVHHLPTPTALSGGLGSLTAACLVPGGAAGSRPQLAVATNAGEVHVLALPEALAGGASQAGGAAEVLSAGFAPVLPPVGSNSGALMGAAFARLPAQAYQLHFLQEPQGSSAGLLLAVCGGGGCSISGGSSSSSSAYVLSWPALECLAQVGQAVAGCMVAGCHGLVYSLHSRTGAEMELEGAQNSHATPLPLAVLVDRPPSEPLPSTLDNPCNTAAGYAFLPVPQLDLSLDGAEAGQGSGGGCTLEVLHRLAAPPASGGQGACAEDAHRGLLKVVSSLQRRVDEGHLQLGHLKQLAQQKQRLAESGEAVLARHCKDTWGPAAAAAVAAERGAEGGGAAASARVAVGAAEPCGPGEWRLRVELEAAQDLAGMLGSACLVASSPTCPLLATHQEGRALPPTAAADSPQPCTAARWELSCLLALPPQQSAALAALPGQGLWADVGVVLGGAGSERQAHMAAEPSCSRFIPAGRVPLPLPGQLLAQCGSNYGAQQQQQQQTGDSSPEPQPRVQAWRHRLDLVAQSEEAAEAYCLHAALQKLGAIPTVEQQGGGGSVADSGQQRMEYRLLGAHATATWHSARFAELALQADDPLLLQSVRAGLASSLQGLAAAAGSPGISLQPSMLTTRHAQDATAAAEALLAEADADLEWVEALLKEKLALGLQWGAAKLPGDMPGILRRQGVALAATAAADMRVARLGA